MSLSAYDLSAGLFIRGLTNLKMQLLKAEEHVAATGSGEAALLGARLAGEGGASGSPQDLHMYPFAAQVHWAAEGAKQAISRLLAVPSVPAQSHERSFAELHQQLDSTIAYLQGISPGDLEAGLDREIVIEHRRGATRARGGQFLHAFAIPHFFYHVTTAYGILRNQGVPLTMSDFLGNWGAN